MSKTESVDRSGASGLLSGGSSSLVREPLIEYWTTFEDGFHGLDPSPPGKGNWFRKRDVYELMDQVRGMLENPTDGDRSRILEALNTLTLADPRAR